MGGRKSTRLKKGWGCLLVIAKDGVAIDY